MTSSRLGRIDRRRLVASSLVGGAAALTAGRTGQARPHSDAPSTWVAQDESSGVPMYRGNAARTGEMPGPGPDASNGVEVMWTFTTGDAINGSTAAVANGVIYVGSWDMNLYAVNAQDGTERWRFPTGAGITSSPAVMDGVVYLGSEDAILYAVNAADGAEWWRFATSGEIYSSPAVVDGVIYVGSNDGNLYAVNAADGTERWRFEAGNGIASSPAVVDGVVYVASDDHNLYAVNADDGKERWRFAGTAYSPAVAEGTVYVRSFAGNLYAVNVEDGAERWRFAIGGLFTSSPAVLDGVVYVGSGTAYLMAVNADDGTERWRYNARLVASSPAVVDGVVYIAGDGIRALNAGDGTEQWRFPNVLVLNSSPVVVGGVVYVGSDDGTLYAIGARVPRLGVGGTARVIEATSLRGGPAPSAVVRAGLAVGTVVTITGESEMSGNFTFWPVTVDETGEQGWVEASTLEPLTSGLELEATP